MGQGSRILVVEPDAASLAVIRGGLEKAGYEVIGAHNGLAAVERDGAPAPDGILLSAELVDVSGYQTVKELKERLDSWTIPVLLMVGAGSRETVENQDLYGAEAYIETPCPLSRLIEKTEAVLDEAHIRQGHEEKLKTRIQSSLDETLEQIVQEAVRSKAQTLVQQLSAGLVDLVEEEARSEMERRIKNLAEEQGQESIAGTVRGIATPLVNEVAEDVVSRQVGSIIDEKTDTLIARLEQEELPEMTRRVITQVIETRMPEIIHAAVEGSRQNIVEELKAGLPRLVDKFVADSLPKVAQNKLQPIIQSQADAHLSAIVGERIRADLETEMENTVRPALKKQLARIWMIAVGVLIVAGGIAAVFFLFV